MPYQSFDLGCIDEPCLEIVLFMTMLGLHVEE